jgi:hypothetical protein
MRLNFVQSAFLETETKSDQRKVEHGLSFSFGFTMPPFDTSHKSQIEDELHDLKLRFELLGNETKTFRYWGQL